jgi:hypothetical protein
MLRLDHVVYGVADLDRAAERWRAAYGLEATAGGRHARWGTANRIIPLGDTYLELISVLDPEQARETVFGRRIAAMFTERDGWYTPVVATDDIEAEAGRLGLAVEPGRRIRPDGVELSWRSAGFEDPGRDLWMPFFMQWDISPDLHPGRATANHSRPIAGISWVEVGGDAARLDSWLGGADVGIQVVDGQAGMRRVGLRTDDGELVIE